MKKLFALLILCTGSTLLPFAFVYAATNLCGAGYVAVDRGDGTTQCTDSTGSSYTVQNSNGQATGGAVPGVGVTNSAGVPVTPATAATTITSTIPGSCTSCNLGYTPLEPIPGITSGTNLTDPHSLPGIINTIFKIFITVGALLAVISLTWGGIEYMVSGSAVTKAGGIKRAQAALWGILLLAAIWLILYTINPQLLNFTLTPCADGVNCTVIGSAITQTTPGTTATTPTTASQQGISSALNTPSCVASLACGTASAGAGAAGGAAGLGAYVSKTMFSGTQ